MRDKAANTGIDIFRMMAALLVITIHTSPLTSVDDTADFILVRIIARVAVPFFFMVSGYFSLNAAESGGTGRLMTYIKRMAILYATAVLLYLPLNIYHGVPWEWASLSGLLKDVFFYGTYLHLWYLPAAILGGAVSWVLLIYLKGRGALIVGLLLYAVGLFGDSYYGFIDQTPVFGPFYQVVFAFFGNTRNGLFFAPVFFILGAQIAKQPERWGRKICLAGLGATLGLMIAEGLLLSKLGVQRHDSMYIMLIPCMVFLFRSLIMWKGRRFRNFRDISAIVYIVHPLIMVLIAKFAAVTELQWLTSNSLARFASVTLVSFGAAFLFAVLKKRLRPEIYQRPCMDRAWLEINLAALCDNARALKAALPENSGIMAVVKANAYGHGDIEVSQALNREGVMAFAVATIDEGIHLRKNGVRGEILVLGYTDPNRAAELSRYRLSQTIVDARYAEELNNRGKRVRAHIKVDTGMHRLGESSDHLTEIAQIFDYQNLSITGMYTHLCTSDSKQANDIAFTELQIQRFYKLVEQLKEKGIRSPRIHIQSSFGVLNYPEVKCGCARVGLALYGAADNTKRNIGLKPVLSLKAKVALVRKIETGECVGYGRAFVAKRDTVLAVLPVGYYDGVPRSLGNGRGCVLLHGCRAPVVGRVCMDQLMVDVTDIPNVERGDIATLIGRDGADEITASEMAVNAGTIPNELLSRLGDRLERV